VSPVRGKLNVLKNTCAPSGENKGKATVLHPNSVYKKTVSILHPNSFLTTDSIKKSSFWFCFSGSVLGAKIKLNWFQNGGKIKIKFLYKVSPVRGQLNILEKNPCAPSGEN
jgi:hypothetical protein